VRVWDAATGTLQQTLEGHSSSVRAVAFSPDGLKLASGSWDKTVRVWDAATGTLQQTLEGHSSSASAVAFPNEHSRAQYFPPVLSVENGWLAVKGVPILRLPHEYRSNIVAVYNNVIAVGCSSGYVLIAKFDL
jgi:WD40 repeat protein